MSHGFINVDFQSRFAPLRLTVLNSGHAQLGEECRRSFASSSFTRLYYIRGGDGVIGVEAQEAPLLPGHMYLLPPGGRYHCYCAARMDCLYFHLLLTLPDGTELFSRDDRVRELPIDPDELERMLILYRSGLAPDALALAGCLYRDVGAFLALVDCGHAPVVCSDLLARLLPLIRAGLSAKLTAGQLAEQLSCSPSTLTKRFRAEMGLPLGAYLDRLLLEKAQQLLQFTELSIGEISDTLRFCDQFYFSRYFKQRTGETPSGYRKRLKRKKQDAEA